MGRRIENGELVIVKSGKHKDFAFRVVDRRGNTLKLSRCYPNIEFTTTIDNVKRGGIESYHEEEDII